MPCSECSGSPGDVPVHRRPQQRRHAGHRQQPDPPRPGAGGEHPERVEAAERPALGPHQPGEDEQAEHRLPAPRPLGLEQHRADDRAREGRVLVADQRVAEERGARGDDDRRDDAHPGVEERRAEPVGEPDEQPEAQQDQPDHHRVGAVAERDGEHRDPGLERVRRRREVRRVVRRDAVVEIARPEQRVARVVVEVLVEADGAAARRRRAITASGAGGRGRARTWARLRASRARWSAASKRSGCYPLRGRRGATGASPGARYAPSPSLGSRISPAAVALPT